MTPQEQRELQKRERDLRRCIFFFADGRRCSMERLSESEQLCRYHFEQRHADEKAVKSGRKLVGTKNGGLETAFGINHALENILRAVAERRIPARDAATIAYICQLLLNTIPIMQKEMALYAKADANCDDYVPEPEFKNGDWTHVLYAAFKQNRMRPRSSELAKIIRERLAAQQAQQAQQAPSPASKPPANGNGATSSKAAAKSKHNGKEASNGQPTPPTQPTPAEATASS